MTETFQNYQEVTLTEEIMAVSPEPDTGDVVFLLNCLCSEFVTIRYLAKHKLMIVLLLSKNGYTSIERYDEYIECVLGYLHKNKDIKRYRFLIKAVKDIFITLNDPILFQRLIVERDKYKEVLKEMIEAKTEGYGDIDYHRHNPRS